MSRMAQSFSSVDVKSDGYGTRMVQLGAHSVWSNADPVVAMG